MKQGFGGFPQVSGDLYAIPQRLTCVFQDKKHHSDMFWVNMKHPAMLILVFRHFNTRKTCVLCKVAGLVFYLIHPIWNFPLNFLLRDFSPTWILLKRHQKDSTDKTLAVKVWPWWSSGCNSMACYRPWGIAKCSHHMLRWLNWFMIYLMFYAILSLAW